MQWVSIIITTRNRPRLLSRAVESARLSGRDPEIVVVDDASTDETGEVCRSLPGIRYVRVERNQGVACARNAGLRASSGQYVSFLDDDDERLPGSLDVQVERLEAEPRAGMIYGQALVVGGSGAAARRLYPAHCPRGDIFWELLGQNFIPCGSVVFRRSCLAGVGSLDERVPGIDDWDFWIRMAERFEVIATEEPVFSWRRSSPGSGQGSSSGARMVRMAVRQFRERWMRLGRAAEAPRGTRRRAWDAFSEGMARHLVWEAVRAQAAGRTRQAAENVLTGLRLLPSAMLRVPFDRRRARAALGLLRRLASARRA
ncbi:MAG: glycosyltransferase family 2 protein [Acidobacteria bacterium]|nr:glycosyltransferase family 2 protein [Acidobacteriota bacterium]